MVEGDIINKGNIHIGDIVNNVYSDSVEENICINKSQYRKIAKQPPFDLPEYYIPRSLTHLKAILDAKKYYYPEKEYRSIHELLNEKQKIVLLGDAGMGKSTELKCFYNVLINSDEDIFPVWVSLNVHLLSESLEIYLSELVNIDSERIVLIMDGYDEIPSTEQPQLNRLISNLQLKRNKIKILLSSRKNTHDINTKQEGFEIYYLNEITLKDVERYFESFSNSSVYSIFYQELQRVKFIDIIKTPFYLNTIVELFLSENELPDTRSKLMKHCIERMISWDDKRSATVISFDKYEVTRVIKKVGLAMEMLCRNIILDTDLRQILTNDEFHDLRYFGVFKKDDGKNDVWKFDHNNFQEYLAASAISHLPFDQIVNVISFEPDYTVLNPSWLKTVSYLLAEIESKQTFDRLLSWLITYNSHFLVNAEPTRIPEDIRFDVFKSIFDEFEKNDTFLYSNHFTEEQLVAFVQDVDDVFIFLLEKYKTSYSIKVKTNALRLLGQINYAKNYDDYQALYDKLIEGINNHRILINGVLLHHMIACLDHTKMLSEDQIAHIINKVYDIQSYDVIGSAVRIINQSKFVDKYINYLVKALQYEPVDKIIDIGLEYNLGISFSKIFTKDGIISLLYQLDEMDWDYDKQRSLSFLSKLIENAYNLYKDDESILFDVINAIRDPNILDSHYYQNSLLNFLNSTGKRDLIFRKLLKGNVSEKIQHEKVLAFLVSEKTVDNLIEVFNSDESKKNWIFQIKFSHNDKKDEVISRIISSIQKNDNKLAEYLIDESNFKQNSFNLLFDPDGFKGALDIFINNFENEKITKDDVNKLINENYNGKNRFKTPDCIISLLQILTGQYKEISVSQLTVLINDEEKIRNYRITKVRESIFNNDRLEIDIIQIEYLKLWVLDILARIRFANLGIGIKYCVVDFSVRFDFDLPFDVLTQFLTFESYVKGKDSCFNWLKTKLSKSDMVRLIKDLLTTNQNLSDRVLLNYFRYLNELHEKNISQFMLTAIKNTIFDQHHRICFIEEYLKSGGSLRSLKLVYDNNDNDIKWHLLERFIEKGESDFVLQILNKNISNILLSKEDRFKSICLLVKMEQDVGFHLYLLEVCDANVAIMDHRKVVKDIKQVKSISFLFSLLEMCLKYQKTMETHSTISDITYVIEKIAFESYENFIRTTSEFENLKHIYPEERPYIISMISGLKDRYYRNKVDKKTVTDVKSFIKQLELYLIK